MSEDNKNFPEELDKNEELETNENLSSQQHDATTPNEEKTEETPKFREDGVLISSQNTDEAPVEDYILEEETAGLGANEQTSNSEDSQDKNASRLTQQPKKKSGFLPGFVGGTIGALIVATIFTVTPALNNIQLRNTSDVSTTTDDTLTKTSNVKVDVTTNTIQAVEKVQNAVVSVTNFQEQQLGLDNWFGGGGESTESDGLTPAGEGSGVIYKKNKDIAYIVTNNHVVDNSDAIEVTLRDGTKLEAELVGQDRWVDLAVLSVPAEKITEIAAFGNSDEMKQGEVAIAIGSPLGASFAGSVTQGIISAKDRLVDVDIDEDGVSDWEMDAIQTDAAINPGNSGGALINIAGQVIGINSLKISNGLVEGMGFAIPSNQVVDIINQLEVDGEIIRPVLGIELRDLVDISAQQQKAVLNLSGDVTEGVVLLKVIKGAAASKAGLEQYDTIVEIDGQPVPNTITLRKILYKAGVGKEIEIKYYRDGKLETTKATLEGPVGSL